MNHSVTAREIDVWCNKAASLTQRLSVAARDFDHLATTYPEMRDKSASLTPAKYNAAKERIDDAYGNVNETRRYLCGMKAGRRARKTRRRHRHSL